MKICTMCKTERTLDLFSKNKRLKSGFNQYCKICKNSKNKSRSKHQRRVEHLLYTYKMSEQQYLDILVDQEYGCNICGDDLKAWDKNTHVDHCHKDSHIRGILCRECNTNLGFYEKFRRTGLDKKFNKYIRRIIMKCKCKNKCKCKGGK